MNFVTFKNTYFDGDTAKAMRQLAYEDVFRNYEMTGSKEALQKIVESISEEDSEQYVRILITELNKNPRLVTKIKDDVYLLQKINMSFEELAQTEKNPFVKKFWIRLLITLLCSLVPILLVCFKRTYGFDGFIYRCAITFSIALMVSCGVLPAIVALSRISAFKKLKQKLQKNPEAFEKTEQKQSEEDTTPIAESCDQSDTTLQELTLNQCKEKLEKTAWSIKNTYIMFLILTALIFLVFPLSFPALLVCIYLYHKSNKRLKQVRNLDFIIRVLPCAGKEDKHKKNAEIQHRKIHFSNGEFFQFECGSDMLPIGMEAHSVYESLDEGDLCYLLSAGNETKIRWIYPCKEYKLSEKEFTKKSDYFIPALHSETKDQ